MDQIKEFDTVVNYKRVAENIKTTAKNLEALEKSGITVQDMSMKNKVPDTNYAIVYKVRINPNKKLIAKKILKHR